MAEQLLDDIYRLEIPIPKNPLKYTNSYVIKHGDGALIIDVGLGKRESYEIFMRETKEIGIDLNKTVFVITHMHADHCGLISDVSKKSSKVIFTKEDASFIIPNKNPELFWEIEKEFGRKYGFPEELLDDAIKRHPGYQFAPKKSIKGKIIFANNGDILKIGLRQLKIIKTPGHTKGHICLYDEANKLLFSGDHVLGNITPNISSFSKYPNPLTDYLKSLDKVYGLDVKVAFAGHRRPIYNFKERIQQIKKHHDERIREVLEVLKSGKFSAYQIASQITWDISFPNWDAFPVSQKWFAHQETVAHLEFLVSTGAVHRYVREENARKIYYFSIT